jgi:hypothetical protein
MNLIKPLTQRNFSSSFSHKIDRFSPKCKSHHLLLIVQSDGVPFVIHGRSIPPFVYIAHSPISWLTHRCLTFLFLTWSTFDFFINFLDTIILAISNIRFVL